MLRAIRCGAMALHLATRRRREAVAIRTLALNRWRRACLVEEERRERARRRLELIRSTIIGLDVNRALEPLFPSASDTALVLLSTAATQPRWQHKGSSLQSPQQLELARRSMEYDAKGPPWRCQGPPAAPRGCRAASAAAFFCAWAALPACFFNLPPSLFRAFGSAR